MKIADIEILELQNIPVTPPLFKQPVRTAVQLLKVKTDDGRIGLSQLGGFMHSATAMFIQQDLLPFLKGRDPLENERLMHQMPGNSTRAPTPGCGILPPARLMSRSRI